MIIPFLVLIVTFVYLCDVFRLQVIVKHILLAGALPLPWSIRMKIALGAARGLAFLHEEAERPVIYRDFKTSNILLDAVRDYNFSALLEPSAPFSLLTILIMLYFIVGL